jgi:hypothetical protein
MLRLIAEEGAMDPKEVREELFLLKKRWNRGEITREEYIAEKAELEAILRDLGEAPPATTPPSPAVRPVQADSHGETISGGATQAPSGPAGVTISGPAGGTQSPLSSAPTSGRPAAGIQAPAGELPLGGLFAGKYRIEKKLGAGGMGVTYKALDEVRGQAVCLKVIRPELAADEGMARRFIHEANAGMKLSHENFVRIHDANVAEGRLFIAMEYVEGTPMRDWMKGFAKRREEVPAEQAVEVARQIL